MQQTLVNDCDRKILEGYFKDAKGSQSGVIRVFLSSTFSGITEYFC